MGKFAIGTAFLLLSLSSTARAEESDLREETLPRLTKWMASMKKDVWTARVTACANWDCNEGTLYMKMPGQIEIDYGAGGRVIGNGANLALFNPSGDQLNTDKLAETELGLMLHGAIDEDVELAAVTEYDRGPEAGKPREILQIELSPKKGSYSMTLIVAKTDFSLMGWKATSARGDVTVVEVRNLRKANAKKAPKFQFPALKKETK